MKPSLWIVPCFVLVLAVESWLLWHGMVGLINLIEKVVSL